MMQKIIVISLAFVSALAVAAAIHLVMYGSLVRYSINEDALRDMEADVSIQVIWRNCVPCKGTGHVIKVAELPRGMVLVVHCNECNGRGVVQTMEGDIDGSERDVEEGPVGEEASTPVEVGGDRPSDTSDDSGTTRTERDD